MNLNNQIPNQSQGIPMRGGSGGIMEMMKAQMMTMTMMSSMNNAGGGTQSNSTGGMFNMIYVFLITGSIDFIFNTIVPSVKVKVREYYNKKLSENDIMAALIKTTEKKKGKASSITIDVNVADLENVVGQSILDYITNCEKTTHISFKKQTYILNQTDVIQLSNDIFAKMNEATTEDGGKLEQIVEIFSYEKHVCELREFVDGISRDYTVKLKNKLGGQICYFNQHPMNAPKIAGGNEKNFSSLPKTCFFGMKAFHTNRQFTNLFGPEIEIVRKRVEFFINNEKWYNEKGIPYTLGLLLSGQAGAGKTSTIKCLANETKRHIININLNNDITKTQMENLFFNEMIMVYNVSTGQNEKYEIPLNKRIYVLEDIDCQGDLVHDRLLKAQEIIDLKKLDERRERKEKRRERQELLEMKKMMALSSQTGMPGPIYPHMFMPPVAVAPTAVPTNTSPPPAIATNPSENSSEKLDLSFLLNLLDGVLEIPGRIVVMTSNHISKLDTALIRPGRIDVIADFKRCTTVTIVKMIEFFYDIKLSDLEKERVLNMRDYLVSPAEMGKIMFENFNEYLESINQLQKISNIPVTKVVELNNEYSDSESDIDTEEYNNITDVETISSDVSGSGLKDSITNDIEVKSNVKTNIKHDNKAVKANTITEDRTERLLTDQKTLRKEISEFNTDDCKNYTIEKNSGSLYGDENTTKSNNLINGYN
jgi:DNA polymerase III delta prime subunit